MTPNIKPVCNGVERQCMVTGEVLDKDHLIRFVLSPDGVVVPDIQGKLPGRGMWVTADRDLVNTAGSRKVFSRKAKLQITVPDDLADQTEARLKRRVLDILGLARKAGLVISGLTKIDGVVNSPRPKPLSGFIHASDGGADGAERISRLARGRPVISLFPREQLSLALGGENVVHAALVKGSLSESFLREADRLNNYMSGRPDSISNETEQRVA